MQMFAGSSADSDDNIDPNGNRKFIAKRAQIGKDSTRVSSQILCTLLYLS